MPYLQTASRYLPTRRRTCITSNHSGPNEKFLKTEFSSHGHGLRSHFRYERSNVWTQSRNILRASAISDSNGDAEASAIPDSNGDPEAAEQELFEVKASPDDARPSELLIRPLQSEDVASASELLADTYSSSMGRPAYRKFWQREISQYVAQRVGIPPSSAFILVALMRPAGAEGDNSETGDNGHSNDQ
ncbi:hypothetical protein CYMTET_6348 [Cymbomonas tetramitiformis]|uniref:Uncharacterized protein n=1 Tax=Cymbomonas tetramitiformis TaxID=36881 RepID=A0AAE0GXC2_9CHLO|nr:hypothetical protein CYMTET_6348 [Cymbomonas tetramitiformis]